MHTLRQNLAVDIYGCYFTAPDTRLSATPGACTTNVLRDPNPHKRSVASVSWHPDGPTKVAVAYAILEFQNAPKGLCLDSCVVNFF